VTYGAVPKIPLPSRPRRGTVSIGSARGNTNPMKRPTGATLTGLMCVLFLGLTGGSGCRSRRRATVAAEAPPTVCPRADEPDPLRAWSGRFPVERGGVVAVLGDSRAGAAHELQKWQGSVGIKAVETSPCGSRLAVWIPGIDCPEPASVREALNRAGPFVFVRCLPPLRAEEFVEACARAALPASTCAGPLSERASVCRPKDGARCLRLAQLAARFRASGVRPDAGAASAADAR
jgi:hypothetical protein